MPQLWRPYPGEPARPRRATRDAATGYGGARTGTRQSYNRQPVVPIATTSSIFCWNHRKQGCSRCAAELEPASPNVTTGVIFCWNQRKQVLRPACKGAAPSTHTKTATGGLQSYNRLLKMLQSETEAGAGHRATTKSSNRQPRKLQQASENASTGDDELTMASGERRKLRGSGWAAATSVRRTTTAADGVAGWRTTEVL